MRQTGRASGGRAAKRTRPDSRQRLFQRGVWSALYSRRATLATWGAASSAEEITGSLEEQGHGMFTYYLLKGLKGEADSDRNGHVSLSEIYAYVQKAVQRAARRQNRDQTPQLQTARPELTLY